MSIDSFGRLRTSHPQTLFDYYPSPKSSSTNSSLDEDIWVNITGGLGSINFNSSNYMDLLVSATGDYVSRYTKQPMEYQPGKSRLIYMTGVLLSNPIGSNTITSRMGLFNLDSDDITVTSGVYFQTNGSTFQWVDVTQTGTDSVNQSDWNIDPFDGNGPSGKTLNSSNITKNFLITINSEWLGTGTTRVGFIIDGILYYAHQFSHSSYSVQYTATPRQRLCYQIIATTIVSGSNSLRQMCCTNISEGGYIPLGIKNCISTVSTGLALGTVGTKYILLGLKLQSTYTNGILKLLRISSGYTASANKMGVLELQLHSTRGSIGSTNGSLSWNNLTDSIAQYSRGTGTQTISTDGYVLSVLYVASQNSIGFGSNDFETLLGRTLCTQYDTLYIVGIGNTNNDTMFASVEFIESI